MKTVEVVVSKPTWFEKTEGENLVEKKAWNEVVKGETILIRRRKLDYIPLGTEGVVITNEELDEGSKLWGHALVGYVLGLKPGYKAIQKYVNIVWKKVSPPQVHRVRDGVFLFQFFLRGR